MRASTHQQWSELGDERHQSLTVHTYVLDKQRRDRAEQGTKPQRPSVTFSHHLPTPTKPYCSHRISLPTLGAQARLTSNATKHDSQSLPESSTWGSGDLRSTATSPSASKSSAAAAWAPSARRILWGLRRSRRRLAWRANSSSSSPKFRERARRDESRSTARSTRRSC